VADKKRPPRYDIKAGGGKSGRLVPIVGTAIVVIFAVVVVYFIVIKNHKKPDSTAAEPDSVQVSSSKLITQPGSTNPKAVLTVYEDFLCPACGNFEQTVGPTISKLIDIGAVAVDYNMVAILDKNPQSQHYSSRAAAAALCVADVSKDAFRVFHNHLYDKAIQPSETGTSFPDNAKLIEYAREAGAAGTVPDCVNSGKYISKVLGAAQAANISGTPTIKLNGSELDPPPHADALVAAVKQIVGDVPGIDTAVAPAQQQQ
jgi:protein-disulfide isomerase